MSLWLVGFMLKVGLDMRRDSISSKLVSVFAAVALVVSMTPMAWADDVGAAEDAVDETNLAEEVVADEAAAVVDVEAAAVVDGTAVVESAADVDAADDVDAAADADTAVAADAAADTADLAAEDTAELAAGAESVTRISGDTRYETAAGVAAKFTNTGGAVIVATGENYPDALCASTLAGCLSAPILMVSRDSLPQCTVDQLKRLNPSKVYIVGGTAVVNRSVERALASYCDSITRLAGADRYETCLAINAEAARIAGSSLAGMCILATGSGFADALSVSAYAYAAKAPIFLCSDGKIPSSATSSIKGFGKAVIVGGTAVVGSSVEKKLDAWGLSHIRLAGDNRYETSQAIGNWATGQASKTFGPSVALDADAAVVATGANFPDALAGGAYAGETSRRVVLVPDDAVKALEYAFGDSDGSGADIVILGGTAAVSKDIEKALKKGLEWTVQGWWQIMREGGVRVYHFDGDDWYYYHVEGPSRTGWPLENITTVTLVSLQKFSSVYRENGHLEGKSVSSRDGACYYVSSPDFNCAYYLFLDNSDVLYDENGTTMCYCRITPSKALLEAAKRYENGS